MNLYVMRSKLWHMAGMKKGGDIPILMWNEYINNAAEEISKLGVIADYYAYCNAIKDQNDYLLPSYVYKLLQVEVYDSDNAYYVPATPVTLDWLNKNISNWRGDDSESYPTYYFRQGNSWLGVYPAFDANVTAGIRIYYYRLDDVLTNDDDTSKIPTQFHDYVVKLAFVKMFPNHPDSKRYKEELAMGWQEMTNFVIQPDENRPVIVRPEYTR